MRGVAVRGVGGGSVREGPLVYPLEPGRWHFRYGPIDAVVGIDAPQPLMRAAIVAARARFQGLLEELVEELALLRSPVGEIGAVRGTVAARMVAACRPFWPQFITPMAAVAGAVADELLGAILAAGPVPRAFVNNGGDIALALAPGRSLQVGVFNEAGQHDRHGHPSVLDARFAIEASSPVRGVATSGWGGRSLSLGIADSVTVLAANAAAADAAATMVANAVDVEDAAVRRVPANEVFDDSDLGERRVTVAVGPLPCAVVETALERGARYAEALRARGLIRAALLFLQGRHRVVGDAAGVDNSRAARGSRSCGERGLGLPQASGDTAGTAYPVEASERRAA